MKKNTKSTAPTRIAYGFGMKRTGSGFLTREEMIFALTDDSKKNKKTVDDFAKKYGLELVDVWYREDNNWGTLVYYNTYSYLKKGKISIPAEKLGK